MDPLPKTYADIYDQSYVRLDNQGPGHFGHLVIRDSITKGEHIGIGGNRREDGDLVFAIRLNKRQAKQVIRAIEKWLKRIEGDKKKC